MCGRACLERTLRARYRRKRGTHQRKMISCSCSDMAGLMWYRKWVVESGKRWGEGQGWVYARLGWQSAMVLGLLRTRSTADA